LPAASFWPGSGFHLVTSVHSPLHGDSAESETTMSSPSKQTRRTIILTALATAVHASATGTAAAEDEAPGSDLRPQKADVLVFASGDRAGEVIKPEELKPGGPYVRAWPKDPKTSVIRKGSRLNELVVVKLDPAGLDDDTRARSADGIVAYSAICSHAGCPITMWVKAAKGDNEVLKCACHNSEFDPRQSAQVVFGPAPRRLPALPLALTDGSITVAGAFIGKPGVQQGG